METNSKDNQPEAMNNDQNNEDPIELAHQKGVFGRSEYAKRDFWNDRFKANKGFFDWYLEYEELKSYFEKTYPITKDSRILMVGCGNSKLSEKMYADGYKNIVNIDISDVVIEQMKIYHEEKGMQMEFIAMDATNMEFSNGSFDVVIDKGTLDAIMCGKNVDVIYKLIQEMTRVLKVEGKLFIISHGPPVSRKELFRKAVGIEKYDFQYSKQSLSGMAQLINIFRTKLKDKPLTHIFKDKDLLAESLKEFKESQKISLLKSIIEKKRAMDAATKESGQAKVQEKINESSTNISTSHESKNSDIPSSEKEKIEIANNKLEENSENIKEEPQSDKDKNTVKDSDHYATEYNPQRQSHCYIYYAKKILE